MRSIHAVMLAGALASLAAPVSAATTYLYEFSTTCDFNCEAVGLAENGPVTGFVEIATELFSALQSFDAANLRNFAIGFGSTVIDRDSAFGASLGGFWGSAPTAIEALDLRAGLTGVPTPGAFASIGKGGGFLSLDSSCGDVTCSQASGGLQALLAPADFHLQGEVDLTPSPLPPPAPAPIPLPGALWLALAACGALGIAARRGRRSPRGPATSIG